MKKLILVAGLSAMLLVGCEETEPPYDVNKLVTVTEVKIEVKTGLRGSKAICFYEDGKVSKNFSIDYGVISQIEDIKEIEKLTDSEEGLFDIVTDGNKIISITLSKNRK